MSLDLLGTALSLLSTYFFIRMHLHAWPVGLLATTVNGYLYWQTGIYADMSLELFYAFNLMYGWYRWAQKKPGSSKNMKPVSFKQCLYISLGVFSLYLLLLLLLTSTVHSNIAHLDALTTALSIAAQWLMCYKHLATWLCWLIVDSLYVWLYFIKGLTFHSLMMVGYMGLAITGYFYWSKAYHQYAHSIQSITQPSTPTPSAPMV